MIILNESKIKYEHLNKLLLPYLEDIQLGQTVNCIVDLKEVIRKLFRPEILTIKEDRKLLMEELSSDIISIISHYRNYFFKKNKYTNFYFLYSKEKCKEILAKDSSYKSEYYQKYFDNTEEFEKINLVRKVVKLVEQIVSIIPNAYFINTSEFDELVFGKAILERTKANELNLVLTNDSLFSQCLNDHTVILNLKGIKSQLLTKENAVSIITKKDEYKFSSNLMGLLLAIGGDKKNSIKNIPGFAQIKAAEFIQNLLNESIITDNPSVAFPIEFSRLNQKNKLHKVILNSKDILMRNYDIISGNTLLYSNRIKINETLVIPKRKVSKEYFLELNAKFFTRFPLMLDMLLRGEKLWEE